MSLNLYLLNALNVCFVLLLIFNGEDAAFEVKQNVTYSKLSTGNQFTIYDYQLNTKLHFRSKRSPNSKWFDTFSPCFITKEELTVNNLKHKRAVQLPPSSACEISKQELDETTESMRMALVDIATLQQTDNCLNRTYSNTCETLMEDVNCAINLVINKFNGLTKNQASAEELLELVKSVERLINIINSKFDSLLSVVIDLKEKLTDIEKIVVIIKVKAGMCKSLLNDVYEDSEVANHLFQVCTITDEELVDIYDKRNKRQVLIASKPRTCNISKEELKKTVHLLETAFLINPEANETCVIESDADECETWISWMECAMNKFIEHYNNLTKNQKTFSDLEQNYKFLKDFYDTVVRSVQSSSQRLSSLSDGFNKTLNLVSKKLADCTDELKRRYEKVRRAMIEACVSNVTDGEILVAVTKFRALWEFTEPGVSNQIVSEIIDKTYDNKWKTKYVIVNILNFIINLPWRSHQITALLKLYEKMKRNDDLKDPMIIKINAIVKSLPDNDHEDKESLSDLKYKFETAIKSSIRSWGYDIRLQKDYSNITLIAANFKDDFEVHLKDIIETAYDKNIRNAESVIYFINSLTHPSSSVTACFTLFEAIKRHHGLNGHELIMLAYRVKQLLDNSGTLTSSDVLKLSRIKSELPNGVRALLWDSYVHIESRRHPDNYLRSEGRTCPGKWSKWRVEIVENGKYIKFFDDYYKCNLMCSNKKITRFLTVTVESVQSDDDIWKVVPINNGNYFYFQNKINSRILDSNDLKGFWASLFSETFRKCSEVHAYHQYTGTSYQHWNIS